MNKQKKPHKGLDFSKLQNMTPMQKKAAIVLLCCVLAVVITTVAVVSIVSGSHEAPMSDASDVSSSSEGMVPNEFELNLEGNDAVLGSTQDAGDAYLKETVFVGDSNVVRMYKNGLITLDQFVGKEGMGVQSVPNEKCVYFEDDEKSYTIPEALAKMKPRRIVVMLGTNNADGNTATKDFISSYKTALNAIKNSYPHTDIIVSAIPPVPYDHSQYPAITMQTIDSMNQALADFCKSEGYKFLNITEELKDSNGYGKDAYFNQGDIHLKSEGSSAILKYVRTHAYESKDRRPDKKNVPKRAEMAATEKKSFTANYYVEQATGGTLKSGDKKGQTKLSFDVKENESITVTAEPKEGYIFVKWSDGKTDATRTDKNLTGNLSVTAQFKAAPSISLSETSITMKQGEDKTLKASVKGGKIGDVVWYVNGDKKGSGESFSLKKLEARQDAYKIKATVVVDSKTYEAEATVKVESAIVEVDSISVGNVTVNWDAGSATLNASVSPSDAVVGSYTWSTNDSSCTIEPNNSSATVKFPVNNTTATVTYTITVKTENGKTANATITVQGKPAPEAKVTSVTPSASSAKEGESISFTATIENGNGQDVTWTTSDGQNGTGKTVNFTFTKAGTYTVTAKLANSTASVSVTINAAEPEPEPEPTPGQPDSGSNSPASSAQQEQAVE